MVLQGIPGAVIDKITKVLGLQTAIEKTQFELLDKIQPVVIAEQEKEVMIKTASVSDATGATILATSAVNDTYIIGAGLSINKDVVSDSTRTSINITLANGETQPVIRLRHEPLTAESLNQSISLPEPIKVLKGSNVLLATETATASIDATGIIYYYEVAP